MGSNLPFILYLLAQVTFLDKVLLQNVGKFYLCTLLLKLCVFEMVHAKTSGSEILGPTYLGHKMLIFVL